MTTKTDKPERIRGRTPVGSAKWAHIHKPREPFGGDKDKGRKYEIEVHFNPDDPAWKAWAAGIMARIRALPQQKVKGTGEPMAKQYPIKAAFNKDGTPTGLYMAAFRTGEKFPPEVFDRYGRKVADVPEIGNGSQVAVAYSEAVFDAFGGGINLYLDAVQIVELKAREGRSADDYGFSTEPIPEEGAPPLARGSDHDEDAGDGWPPRTAPEDDLPF